MTALDQRVKRFRRIVVHVRGARQTARVFSGLVFDSMMRGEFASEADVGSKSSVINVASCETFFISVSRVSFAVTRLSGFQNARPPRSTTEAFSVPGPTILRPASVVRPTFDPLQGSPPRYVSFISTTPDRIPASGCCFIASWMRCVTNHALLIVMSSSRAIW